MASKLHDEHRLQSWREEQHFIASQVVVPPEESSFVTHSTTTIVSQLSERYALLSQSSNDGETTQEGGKSYLLIGGVDVSFPAAEDEEDANMGDAVAVYVILKYDKSNYGHSNSTRSSPEVVYRSHKFYKPTTPYIPSYLAFREIDPLMELITQQRNHKPHLTPNVIMVDGNGQWHDRHAGLACFVGVKSGIPTIGVGKTFYSLDNATMTKGDVLRDVKDSVQSWYYDAYVKQQDDTDKSDTVEKRGLIVVDNGSIPHHSNEMRVKQQQSPSPIAYDDMLVKLHQVCSGLAIPMRRVGKGENETVLAYAIVGHGGGKIPTNSIKMNKFARGSKNPIYVSCGSHISLLEAVSLVAWTSIVRIPEPIREADLYGRQLLREQAS